MKQREFRNKVVSHLGIYKDRVLNLKNKGLYKDKEYEHIINVDKTSNKEDIIKKYNGIIVEKKNIEDLSRALLRIKDDYSMYDKEEIREKTILSYSEKMIVEKLKGVYKEVNEGFIEKSI